MTFCHSLKRNYYLIISPPITDTSPTIISKAIATDINPVTANTMNIIGKSKTDNIILVMPHAAFIANIISLNINAISNTTNTNVNILSTPLL